MTRAERRAQRTRELLQKTLIELMGEKAYDAITVQHIADQANIGRTTFYLHFKTKDELFISCHEAMVSKFPIAPLHPLSREELLSPEAPEGLKSAYQHLEDSRAMLYAIFQGKDSLIVMRRIRDWNAQEIETNLRTVFAEEDSTIPLDVLANYLAGAQIALLHWWLEKRQRHTLANLAQTFHRLQRAVILHAFGMQVAD